MEMVISLFSYRKEGTLQTIYRDEQKKSLLLFQQNLAFSVNEHCCHGDDGQH